MRTLIIITAVAVSSCRATVGVEPGQTELTPSNPVNQPFNSLSIVLDDTEDSLQLQEQGEGDNTVLAFTLAMIVGAAVVAKAATPARGAGDFVVAKSGLDVPGSAARRQPSLPPPYSGATSPAASRTVATQTPPVPKPRTTATGTSTATQETRLYPSIAEDTLAPPEPNPGIMPPPPGGAAQASYPPAAPPTTAATRAPAPTSGPINPDPTLFPPPLGKAVGESYPPSSIRLSEQQNVDIAKWRENYGKTGVKVIDLAASGAKIHIAGEHYLFAAAQGQLVTGKLLRKKTIKFKELYNNAPYFNDGFLVPEGKLSEEINNLLKDPSTRDLNAALLKSHGIWAEQINHQGQSWVLFYRRLPDKGSTLESFSKKQVEGFATQVERDIQSPEVRHSGKIKLVRFYDQVAIKQGKKFVLGRVMAQDGEKFRVAYRNSKGKLNIMTTKDIFQPLAD